MFLMITNKQQQQHKINISSNNWKTAIENFYPVKTISVWLQTIRLFIQNEMHLIEQSNFIKSAIGIDLVQ